MEKIETKNKEKDSNVWADEEVNPKFSKRRST